MRCICCDKLLTDYEVTIKYSESGEYMDTCLECLSFIPEVEHEGNLTAKDFIEVEEEHVSI